MKGVERFVFFIHSAACPLWVSVVSYQRNSCTVQWSRDGRGLANWQCEERCSKEASACMCRPMFLCARTQFFLYVCVFKVFLLQVVLWWWLEGGFMPLNPLSGCLRGGSVCVHPSLAYACLPPTLLNPPPLSPHPLQCLPLSRKTPAVKVVALPGSIILCFKSFLRAALWPFVYTTKCFLKSMQIPSFASSKSLGQVSCPLSITDPA